MGTYEKRGLVTYPSAADLSAKQYCWVAVDSNGRVAVVGDGARADGVLQNDPAAIDREAAVAIDGIAKTIFGATVTAGQDVASDADGKTVPAATGDYVLGTCREGGALNEIGSVQIGTGARVQAAAP